LKIPSLVEGGRAKQRARQIGEPTFPDEKFGRYGLHKHALNTQGFSCKRCTLVERVVVAEIGFVKGIWLVFVVVSKLERVDVEKWYLGDISRPSSLYVEPQHYPSVENIVKGVTCCSVY